MKTINVDGANGRYYILRNGKILSFCNQQFIELTPQDNGRGYKYIKINGKNYYIHKLVADTFLLYDKQKKPKIHHIDLNPSNNAVENLLPLDNKKHYLIHHFLKKFYGNQ